MCVFCSLAVQRRNRLLAVTCSSELWVLSVLHLTGLTELLLLFLGLFFQFYWDAEVSALWQLSHSLLSVSALAPFFLKWWEWARTGEFERVEEREYEGPNLPSTLPSSPSPYSPSPLPLLSCFIPRVWPPVRFKGWWKASSHTPLCTFKCACTNTTMILVLSVQHADSTPHTGSNCYIHAHAHTQSGGTTQRQPPDSYPVAAPSCRKQIKAVF